LLFVHCGYALAYFDCKIVAKVDDILGVWFVKWPGEGDLRSNDLSKLVYFVISFSKCYLEGTWSDSKQKARYSNLIKSWLLWSS
jgi:hypothetical protein